MSIVTDEDRELSIAEVHARIYTASRDGQLKLLGDLYNAAHRRGTDAERKACERIATDLLRPQQLEQQAGEMAAQEKRTAMAVISYIAAAIRARRP